MMVSTDYSDTTPDVTLTYDNFARPVTQSNGVAKSTFAYNPGNLQIDTETIQYDLDPATPGYEFTRILDRSQDTLGRDAGWKIGTLAQYNANWEDGNQNPDQENAVAYGYSTTDGRLASVSGGGLQPPSQFNYTYTPNSNLLASITGPIHTVTNTWEPTRNVLELKENKVGALAISSFNYGVVNNAGGVNEIGQRTSVRTSGTAFSGASSWSWAYDSLGQVTLAEHGTNANFNRAYEYDNIGNRLKSADSLNLPTSNNYTPTPLNQYEAIGTLEPEYDFDGNATAYPLPANLSANSTLGWDAENRLVSASVPGGDTVSFVYDARSRRIAETVGTTTKITIYDGWNPIAEYTSAGLQPASLAKTFTWGMDLSGSMQGAGGVGGLLAVTDSTGTYYPTYDGNGNISEYLNSSGAVAAHYEYDPFGKTTVATGPKAQDFSHRFSTKPLDATTGLYYYGYRYYDPVTGRWPSRDPIEERGGLNLYGFVGNNGINQSDVLGLREYSTNELVCRDIFLNTGSHYNHYLDEFPARVGSENDRRQEQWADMYRPQIWATGRFDDYPFQYLVYNNSDSLGAFYNRDRNARMGIQMATDWAVGTLAGYGVGATLGVTVRGIRICCCRGRLVSASGRGAIRLVHMTSHTDEILSSQRLGLPSNIYAGPASNAGRSGWSLTARTGLNPGGNYRPVFIPAAGETAFRQVTPVGIFTSWQRLTGQQYTARGIMDLSTGAFTRTGANWNQALIYGGDAAVTLGGVGAGACIWNESQQ